MQDLMKSGEVV